MSKIADLNDAFRRNFACGRVVITAGVSGLPPEMRLAVIQEVMTFDSFTNDNDPRGEHDFGNFEHAGEKFFWKIDHYNRTMTGGSEDPADPSKTTRVLTIMLACEY